MEKKLSIYYDAEFTGLHRNTTLVSIGMVSESGAVFYAEFTDYDESQVDDWLMEHVISNLLMNNVQKVIYTTNNTSNSVVMKGTKNEVSNILLSWLKNESTLAGSQIQFYTDCYAYDWVLLNDLTCGFGVATNTPEYINYIPIDLSTALFVNDVDPDISREDYANTYLNAISEKMKSLTSSLGLMQEQNEVPKHNSLWDAYVCHACFYKLFH